MPRREKLIIIVGPTASGKSDLAVRLAKKFDGEVISADSRQIYRDLDIGSGKVPGRWKTYSPATIRLIRSYENDSGGKSRTHQQRKVFIYRGIAHHCIDFVSPLRTFTAADFVRLARRAIRAIARRGRIPIIAGGTAFWIDALVYDLSLPAVKPNLKLRRRLEKKSPAELLAILKKLDARRATAIEQKNPRRLIRAIEIARVLGSVPLLQRHTAFHTLWIGLNPPPKIWSHRSAQRVKGMIRRGLVRETKALLRHGISRKRVREFGFEYAAALDALDKRISHAELAERVRRDTGRFARRQMRWWKWNRDIYWISDARLAERRVRTFLRKTPSSFPRGPAT